ncbi:hypothetical protein LTR36_005048 [Oleoguttula mirabilis]|uniref:FAD-binding domain-containing protein n=1 Tax=Oleoguttula mirabilis TaxID=1507867 RepID=A0AAV9JVI9_9PEZI|nr:hypothetical protein LTR36_005048 [Oleoguttula mirabilis]
MATPKNILIAGGGIAGPSCALLLTRKGHKVTIVERAPQLRSTGQQIDVSGIGSEIVKHMGIWQALHDRSTGEEGLKFVGASNNIIASFPVSKDGGPNALVKEIEILRGEMVDVIYQETKDTTNYVFGDYITALSEQATHVTVSFANSPDQDFDMVIAADGLFSQTRGLVFPKSAVEIKNLGGCVALMTIPWEEADGNQSRWYCAPGGRAVFLRPQFKAKKTGAYLGNMTADSRRLVRLPVQEQKEAFAEMFRDLGWETPRIIREMMKADDLYAQELAQAKMGSWVKGRVALLGDAGYCPSPVSGQGTTLAFIGAYILAGCISTHDDYEEALRQYEEQMRPFVEQGQKLLPGVPGIANPQTEWGRWALYTFVWLAGLVNSWGIVGLVTRVVEPLATIFSKELELPKY